MLLIPRTVNSTSGFLLQTMLYLTNFTDHSPNNTLEDYYHLHAGADTDKFRPKCYGVYGCFPIESPWKTDSRQVSLYPESPLKINPRYPVFHKDSRLIPYFLDLNEPHDTKKAGIDPNGPIYLISHGYLESGDRPWIQDMVNALLDVDQTKNASVIIVDWGGGSSPPYSQAVANIRLVGAITAHIIFMIYEELGMDNLNHVHMLGHSLGAHLSGYTGQTLQKDFDLMLGRITGMDPAEPLFSNTDPIVRLDRTDAQFVDVIHTDALPFSSGGNNNSSSLFNWNSMYERFDRLRNLNIGLGMREAIGHVDFYPNGGYNNPGCDASMQDYIQQESGSFFYGIQQFFSCNHIRSHQFMTECLRSHCSFSGITCDSYDDFKHGYCFECSQNNHFCLKFGLNSINSYHHLLSDGQLVDPAASVRVYLMTSGLSPYCRTHYKVSIQMSDSEESMVHGGEIGIVTLVMHSQVEGYNRSDSEQMKFSQDSMYFEPGINYVAVMPGRDVGPNITSVSLNWQYTANPLNPLTWRILATPRVYIDHILVESLEFSAKLKLCPMYLDPVQAGTSKEFMEEYCPNY